MQRRSQIDGVILQIDQRLRGYHDPNSSGDVYKNIEGGGGGLPSRTIVGLRVSPHPIDEDNLLAQILELAYEITKLGQEIAVEANKPDVVSFNAEKLRRSEQVRTKDAVRYAGNLAGQLGELQRVHATVLEYLGKQGNPNKDRCYKEGRMVYLIPISE